MKKWLEVGSYHRDESSGLLANQRLDYLQSLVVSRKLALKFGNEGFVENCLNP